MERRAPSSSRVRIPQGLNERILILREQDKTGPANDPDANAQLTMNFQPAVYPEGGLAPAITVQPGAQEYWRFLNSTARQFTSLQLFYGLTQQTFEVVSIDGVQLGTPIYTQTLNIFPAGRMEFIIPGLPAGQTGTFETQGYTTGTVGDLNGPQVLAKMTTSANSQKQPDSLVAHVVKPPLSAGSLLRSGATSPRYHAFAVPSPSRMWEPMATRSSTSPCRASSRICSTWTTRRRSSPRLATWKLYRIPAACIATDAD